MESHWDIVVIGGGAAGFFSAITAAEHANEPLKIAILEKSSNVLAKVKISGGGRCNVTHDCLQPRELTSHYPRGQKNLIGPFHHFGPEQTIEWFQSRGVELKTESDGRMFPISDSSETIIDCLKDAATAAGVEIITSCGVKSVQKTGDEFTMELSTEDSITARHLIIATGGTRSAAGARLAEQLGHSLIPPVPSLFTFHINDARITGLEGLSVSKCDVSVEGTKLKNVGPVLITHWGLSGPGILKLSSIGAQDLAEQNYHFTLNVNWCPKLDLGNLFQLKRQEWGKKQIIKRSPLASIPKRLWESFCLTLEIPESLTWSQLNKHNEERLIEQLQHATFTVTGKSMNKEEFVTCGGVDLKDVNFKTLESRICPNLHFAGEILNIDGITGGFNFQNAWTTGFLAGTAISSLA